VSFFLSVSLPSNNRQLLNRESEILSETLKTRFWQSLKEKLNTIGSLIRYLLVIWTWYLLINVDSDHNMYRS